MNPTKNTSSPFAAALLAAEVEPIAFALEESLADYSAWNLHRLCSLRGITLPHSGLTVWLRTSDSKLVLWRALEDGEELLLEHPVTLPETIRPVDVARVREMLGSDATTEEAEDVLAALGRSGWVHDGLLIDVPADEWDAIVASVL